MHPSRMRTARSLPWGGLSVREEGSVQGVCVQGWGLCQGDPPDKDPPPPPVDRCE